MAGAEPKRAKKAPTKSTGLPAHRPSRRNEIIGAAIRVFSRTPLSEATVEQIADESGMAVTAVYYHFGGKEEVFDEAFRTCLVSVTSAIDDVRDEVDDLDADVLRRVIFASWTWWRTHPVEARFLSLHGGGATPASRRTFDEWQQFHSRRAFDYLPEDEMPPRTSRRAREQHAARLLAYNFLNRMLNGSQIAWLEGPLRRLPHTRIQEALADVLIPVMTGPLDLTGRPTRPN